MKPELIAATQANEPTSLPNMLAPGEMVTGYSHDNVDVVVSGVGSGVVIILEDRVCQVYGLAHVVLPYGMGHFTEVDGKEAYFADKAMGTLIETMQQAGAVLTDEWQTSIMGGAQVRLPLNNSKKRNPHKTTGHHDCSSYDTFSNTGLRNVIAITNELLAYGFSFYKSTTGGRKGRTIRFTPSTGKISIKFLGEEESEW